MHNGHRDGAAVGINGAVRDEEVKHGTQQNRRADGLTDEAAEALWLLLEMPVEEEKKEEPRRFALTRQSLQELLDELPRYAAGVAAELGVSEEQAARYVLMLPAGKVIADVARRLGGAVVYVDPLLAPHRGETLAEWLARTSPATLWRMAPGYYLSHALRMRGARVPLESERFVLI